jgi:hypothetical protein
MRLEIQQHIHRSNLDTRSDVNFWRIVLGEAVTAALKFRYSNFLNVTYQCIITFECFAIEVLDNGKERKRRFGTCHAATHTVNGFTHMPDAIEFIDNFNNRFGNTLFGVRSGGHFQCVHNLIITEYGCKLDKDIVLLEISVDAPDPLFWCEHVLTE